MTTVLAHRPSSATSIGGPDRPGLSLADAVSSSHRRLLQLIEDIVSDVFGIEAGELRKATRGRAKIALARQVAMYIAHVGYGLSLTDVGRLFERDRTTVAHACHVVELKRDDEEFEEGLVLLEMIVRAINGAGILVSADPSSHQDERPMGRRAV